MPRIVLLLHRPVLNLLRVASLVVGVAALAMIATPVASAAGAVRFVATPDNGGSDTANSTCASTSPCATITKAVANSVSGDVIMVGPGSFGTPQSTSATITIGTSVTIEGSGVASTTLVDSLVISPGVTATVTGVTVDTASFETGVLNEGTLTLGQSVVTGNNGDGTSAQGSIVSALAAGIANVTEFKPTSGPQQNASPSLTLIGSTVDHNNDSGETAGISLPTAGSGSSDTATIVNSTISGNSSGTNGAIYATGSTTALTVLDSTITGNTAQGGRTGGLGIGLSATASVTNTILAANTVAQGSGQVPSDCNTNAVAPAGTLSGGHDLIGNGDACAGAVNGANGDEIGTAAAPLDPGVGPLAGNGGPTPTEALAAGSAAVRAGDPSVCEAAPVGGVDQRGASRNAAGRGTCDIGAYDTASVPIALYVNSATGHDSGCSAASQAAPFATLSAALACAANGDAISLAAGNYGMAHQSTASTSTALARNLTLSGAGATTTLVATVIVEPFRTVTIGHLTVNTADYGTGILNEGRLTLSKDVITNNSGDGLALYGAGGVANATTTTTTSPTSGPVQNLSPALSVLDSTIANNTDVPEPYGGVGGIFLPAPATGQTDVATIVNSTITGNSSSRDGGILAAGPGTTLSLRDSTIDANTGGASAGSAGGLVGTITASGSPAITLTDTILAANTAGSTPADCASASTTAPVSGGHNLIGAPGNCSGLVNGANADQVGTAAAPLNPHLGALAANGGSTPTQVLLTGSPAISAGNPTDCAASPVNNLDQRGDARNASTRHTCDIGAYDTAGINPTPLSLTTATLAAGRIGSAYSGTLTAAGGIKPYTWSLSGGSLPAGLSLNTASGAITGTPTTAATSSFTVKVTDAASPTPATVTRALSITIAGPALAVSTTSLPAGQVGSTYSASLSATGGLPGYRWSLTAGSLPAGLSLASGGQVLGTPTASGTFTLTVTVTDSALPIPGTASRTLSVSIAIAPGVYAANTGGNSLTEYSLSANGDSAPKLTLSGPDTGLSSPESVILDATGRTYVANASAGTVTEYAPGASGDARPQLTITGIPLPRALALDSAGDLFVASLGTGGFIYEYAPGASGGTRAVPIFQSQSPRGLAFDASGHLYVSDQSDDAIREYSLGTQSATLTESATLTNTLTGPATSLSSPEDLVIDPTGHLSVANSGSGTITIYAPGATGDTAPVAALSAGLQSPVGIDRGTDLTVFVGDSGLNAIVEYPSGASTPGATIAGPDTGLSNPLSVAATPPLSILSTRLPAAVTGERYLVNLRAAEGTTPYRWTVARGRLPRGLRLSPAGAIIGTPRKGRVGTYRFTARVKDASHPRQTVNQKLVISLRRAPRVSISRLTIAPHTFTAASSGASVTVPIHPPGTGATVSYRLSAAGTVRFTVEQLRLGRRHGSGRTESCVAPTTRAPNGRRCMRAVVLHGSFTRSGTRGTNRLHFSGRLGGRRLTPGTYTLVATSRTVHGAAREVSITFRILR